MDVLGDLRHGFGGWFDPTRQSVISRLRFAFGPGGAYFQNGRAFTGGSFEAESTAHLCDATLQLPRRGLDVRVEEGAIVQPPEISVLADPAEEILLRVQPSFIQLAAVPVIDDLSAVQEPLRRDE
jgi:hypothetical protein